MMKPMNVVSNTRLPRDGIYLTSLVCEACDCPVQNSTSCGYKTELNVKETGEESQYAMRNPLQWLVRISDFILVWPCIQSGLISNVSDPVGAGSKCSWVRLSLSFFLFLDDLPCINTLKGLMLKFQYFGHLMWTADSLEKTLMLGKVEGRRRRGQQRRWWLDGITDSVGMNLGKFWDMVGAGKLGKLQTIRSQRVGQDLAT